MIKYNMKKSNIVKWSLIGYLISLVIILAFLWKYLPIWESILLGLWATCSLVAGFLIARYYYLNKE